MPVVEFALIELREGYDELEFLEVLALCEETQVEWMRHNQPLAMHNAPNAILSTMYIQKSHPPYLLITAPWDSPGDHREWIKSKDNQTVFAKLSEFIAPGCESTLIFHLDPAGTQSELRGEFLSGKPIDIHRLGVKPEQKAAVEETYRALEKDVLGQGPGQRTWAGWRIETRPDGEDEFVVFRSNVPEEKLEGLLKLADIQEHRTFHHVVG